MSREEEIMRMEYARTGHYGLDAEDDKQDESDMDIGDIIDMEYQRYRDTLLLEEE